MNQNENRVGAEETRCILWG